MQSRKWTMALLMVTLAACSGTDPAGPDDTATIHLRATTFSPNNLRIALGMTVEWINDTNTLHNITPNNATQVGVWGAVSIGPQQDATFSHRFINAGTYDYRCTIHAGMTGRIIVE